VTGIANGTTLKIWGRSSNDLYFVGTNGSITHYIPYVFQKMESGTTLDLTGIWGNEKEIWVVGSAGQTGVVLRKSGDGLFESISDSSAITTYPPSSVWCDNKDFLLFGGYGVMYRDTSWKSPPDDVLYGGIPGPYFYIRAVHGSGRNNVWVIGDFHYAAHYNGRSWKYYREILDYPGGSQSGRGVSVLPTSVYIVGSSAKGGISGRVAYVLVGKRK